MTERSLFPESVEVRQRDLAYTESTKSEQLRQRLIDTLGPARRDGLITTVNGINGTLIDVAAGRGYTPNGELAILETNQTAISLSDYTNNVNNFVYLTYREQETTPAAHETDGSSRNTRIEALIGVSVLTAAEYAALPATNSAGLATLAQDRMLLIATVNANGVAVPLLSGDITIEPITTLATEETVDTAIAVATEGRQRLGYIPDIDPPTPAAGDGVTDDALALTLAIAQVPTGGTLDLGGKTYFIAGTVDVARSDITIANGTILMTGLTGIDTAAFTVTGSSGLDTAAVGLAVVSQRTNIEFFDLTGYAVGDIVYMSSSVSYSASSTLGELNRIRAIIPFSDILDLDRGLLSTYTGTGTLSKITPRKNVLFDRINFIGATPVTPTDIRVAIRFDKCDRPTVRNCTFSSVYSICVEFIRCYDGRVDSCTFRDTSLGEGVQAVDGCFNIRVSKCTADNTRILFESTSGALGSGINASMHLTNCEYNGIGALALFNSNTFDCSANDSTSVGADNAILSLADNVNFSNNRIRSTTSNAIFCQPAKLIGGGSRINVSNNDINGVGGTGIAVLTSAGGLNIASVVINGNQVSNIGVGQSAILINSAQSGNQIEGVSISGNSTFLGNSATHINLVATASSAILQGVTVSGNTMLGGAACGLRLGAAPGAFVREVSGDNVLRGAACGTQLENSGSMEHINLTGVCEAGTGYDIINNTGATIANANLSGSCRGIGVALSNTGRGVNIINSGTLDRVRFTGNFNATSFGVNLENLAAGAANDVTIGGIIRADKEGVRVVNTGSSFRLKIEGNILGGTASAVAITNLNAMNDVSIDAVAVGQINGCRIFHDGNNTLNTLTIRGQYSTGNDPIADGILINSPNSNDLFENVFIDAKASGTRSGLRIVSSGNITRMHIAGSFNGGTADGLTFSLLSASTISRLIVNATCEGAAYGIILQAGGGGVNDASFNVVARGGITGMGLFNGLQGHVAGHFIAGQNSAFLTSSPACDISLTGRTTGGTYGVQSLSGTVLCVGVLSTDFSIAARTGAGIIFGNAAAGHCQP